MESLTGFHKNMHDRSRMLFTCPVSCNRRGYTCILHSNRQLIWIVLWTLPSSTYICIWIVNSINVNRDKICLVQRAGSWNKPLQQGKLSTCRGPMYSYQVLFLFLLFCSPYRWLSWKYWLFFSQQSGSVIVLSSWGIFLVRHSRVTDTITSVWYLVTSLLLTRRLFLLWACSWASPFMARYNYDEGGGMAAYFLVTILALILTPMTISSLRKKSASVSLILVYVMFSIHHISQKHNQLNVNVSLASNNVPELWRGREAHYLPWSWPKSASSSPFVYTSAHWQMP